MTALPDLQSYLQRRRLQNYEQGMARLAYAYGVDVRRSRWLASSSVGNTLVRTVDRRWPAFTEELMRGELQDPGSDLPVALLQRIGRIRHLLRAPLPVLRVLSPQARRRHVWPVVTPLGPTHGDIHWLVLDLEQLADCSVAQLDFLVGVALGHLQCDHGVFFAAHVLAARREGVALELLRRALSPWSRVMVFSADRAGLLAVGDLDEALTALRVQAADDEKIAWLPRWPSTAVRADALVEFDRSAVMARIRSIRARVGGGPEISLVEPAPAAAPDPSSDERGSANTAADAPLLVDLGIPESAWSLARCDARLTERLRLL